MGDSCDEDNGSGPISRSSVTHVAYIVAKFNEEKRELVRQIGFGGILDLPQITKVDRKFTLWLLSNIDCEKRTIIVNGEPVADVIDFEASRIMGIPCGRKIVCSLKCDDKKSKAQFIQNSIGSSVGENNSLIAAESIVTAQYEPSMAMTAKDKQAFKVSFVVWVMGHLLAPTKKHNVGSDRFWGALLNPDEIKEYNWAAYVVDELVNAAKEVQDAIKHNKNINTTTGCSILLQIIYLEAINLGSLNRPRAIAPRVKAYDGKSLSLMISADKASSSSGSGNATWGSNVRHLPEDPEDFFQIPNSDVNIKSSAEDNIISDIGKYVRQNFGDKVTTAQSVALNWFNARCLAHYNQLRLNIQQDTIALVGKLFGSPTLPDIFGAARSNNIGARPAHSEPSRQAHSEPSRTILKNKRPYGSYSTPYKRRYGKKHRVSFRQYDLPDTLLTGGSRYGHGEVGDQLSDSGYQSGDASQGSGFTIEAPSFDLGIDFGEETNTAPSVPLNIPGSEEAPNVCSGDVNMSSSLPEDSTADTNAFVSSLSANDSSAKTKPLSSPICIGSSTPDPCNTLSATPPSAMSITNPQFSTPDQKIRRTCDTSPGSLSKILAEGDLVFRMTSCEDSPNINIKPWDDGYSDEPIEKHILGTPKLPESPWTYNLCHREPPRDLVVKFFDDVSDCNLSQLNRTWLAHTSPRHIEIDGTWIRKCFIPETSMNYDVCDLAIRRLKQLDHLMYSEKYDLHWRHILESEFAIFALSGEIPYNRKAIIEQFVGPYFQYKLENCRMLVVPAYILFNWCSYFFDFKDKCVHVIDPLYNKDQSAMFKQLHLPNIVKVAGTLMKCFAMFFENWHENLQNWSVRFVEPPIVDATPVETGLLNLMYIRQFDGCKFHLVDRDYFRHFRKVMLYELMSLSDNHAKPPFNLTITIDD